MKYSALIFDLDGTAIPSRLDGMPSQKVIDAVAEARKTAKVSIATGRPFSMCSDLIKSLGIVSPCVVSGGTQIVDPISGKPIFEQLLARDQSAQMLEIAKKYQIKSCFDGGSEEDPLTSIKITGDEKIFALFGVTEELAKKVQKELLEIDDVAVSTVVSWRNGYDIHVVHKLGTKKHGIEKLMEIEGIKKEDLMVAGDGNNDLPLFAAAAFKVAMGNAGDDLKAAADEIAPTIDEDGLAWAIEKFIL